MGPVQASWQPVGLLSILLNADFFSLGLQANGSSHSLQPSQPGQTAGAAAAAVGLPDRHGRARQSPEVEAAMLADLASVQLQQGHFPEATARALQASQALQSARLAAGAAESAHASFVGRAEVQDTVTGLLAYIEICQGNAQAAIGLAGQHDGFSD